MDDTIRASALPTKGAEALSISMDTSSCEHKSLSSHEDFSPLKSFIAQAVKEALQPVVEHIEALEAIIARQAEKIAALEATQEVHAENGLIQLRLIAQLREGVQKTPVEEPKGTKTVARVKKIDEVLKARGSTTFKELERILRISPKEMNRLLARLDMRRYEVHHRPGDNREKVLRLKVQIS